MEKLTEKTNFKQIVKMIRTRLKEFAAQQREWKESGRRSEVMYNRFKITALHNFYLELRGKLYRHATQHQEYQKSWAYKNAYEKFEQEYKLETL